MIYRRDILILDNNDTNLIKNTLLNYDIKTYESYLFSRKGKNQPLRKVMEFSEDELSKEIWKPFSYIPELYKNILSKNESGLFSALDFYYGSTLGRIAINKYSFLQLLEVLDDGEGYKICNLHVSSFPIKVHRIIALLFRSNPDPENFREINHISNPRCNNKQENLMWCHQVFNHNYIPLSNPNDPTDFPRTNKTNRSDYSKNTGENLNNKISCIKISTGEETIYNSSEEASIALNIDRHQLRSCCHGAIKRLYINGEWYDLSYKENHTHIVNKAKDWEGTNSSTGFKY